MSESQWQQKPERGSLILMRIISGIARHLGRGFGRILLYPISFYFLITSADTRAASKDFLSRVLPNKVTWRDTFKQLYVFATTLLDRIFLFSDRLNEFEVEASGVDEVLTYLAKGKGCLLLGSHLGSFEIMRAMAVKVHAVDFGLRILMRRDESEKISKMLNEMAPELAEIVIPIGQPDTMLRVKEAIDDGCLVGLLGDRVCAQEKTTLCDFLGDKAEFPMAAAQLSLALKAPIFTFYGLYMGANRYSIYFNLLCQDEDIARDKRDDWMQQVTQRYADELADYARKAPYNWFNFYPFWKTKKASDNA